MRRPTRPADSGGSETPVVALSTEGRRIRTLVVRRVLLREFLRHDRVVELFVTWHERSGLGARLRRLSKALDRAAKIAGVEKPTQLIQVEFIAQEKFGLYEAALSEVRQALDAVLERYEIPDGCLSEIEEFVHSLGIPELWPWLAIELAGRFYAANAEAVYCLLIDENGIPEDGLVRESVILAWPQAGAAPSVAARQLRERFEQAFAELQARTPPGAMLPSDVRESLERRARWFYRVEVEGATSVNALAIAEFGKEAAPNRRKDIRDGIHSVKQFLRSSDDNTSVFS